MKNRSQSDTFMYFAYGSNLLKRRIHINNPSAEYIGIGRLDNYRLDFLKWSPNWRGCSATIEPHETSYVWGAVWRVNVKDMPALDRQEGVDTNWYFPKTVQIMMSDHTNVECRTYQQSKSPPTIANMKDLPKDRQPSKTYLEVILKGAEECKLPEEYISKLKQIPHNGEDASPEMLEKLKL